MVLNACIDFSYMRDVYVVFYSSFVDNKRCQIKNKLESIFEKYNVSKASQKSIEEMVKALSKKTFTPDGKAWKMRTADIVLFSESKVTLLTSIYRSVLPIFKKYVMLFQRDKPMIHELHYDQIDLFNQFLSYFVKPDVLAKCTTGRKIVKLKLDDPSNLLSKKNIFMDR